MMHSGASVALVKQWDIVEFRWTFFLAFWDIGRILHCVVNW